jgi:hypothetical protein
MKLEVGDLVGLEKVYKDGWARGQNVSRERRRGLLPMGVLAPIVSGPSHSIRRGELRLSGVYEAEVVAVGERSDSRRRGGKSVSSTESK